MNRPLNSFGLEEITGFNDLHDCDSDGNPITDSRLSLEEILEECPLFSQKLKGHLQELAYD